jgi:ribosomal protein L13
MKAQDIKERIINKILPRLEKKLERRLVKRLAIVTKEEYPSESQFKKKFVKEVKAAQKRIKEGKGKTYTYEEFKKILTKG